MNKFSEFNIKPSLPNFVGQKIEINKVLNRVITVHDYRISDSNYKEKGNDKYLTLQITIGETKRVIFSGSKYLIEQIEKVSKEKFPFTTTIISEDDRYEFS